MTRSLYQRLGGEKFLVEATEMLYARILIDDDLSPFFAGMNVKRIEARQRAFLAYAFAGPEIVPAVDLRAVHAPLLGKGLTHEHFNLLKRHLCDTMIDLKVNENLIIEAIERVEATRADVMGEVSEPISEPGVVSRCVTFGFGIFCYGLGMASLLYAVPWLGDFWLANTLDGARTVGVSTALLVNLGLIALFVVQHSVMARPRFKAWWTRFVPAVIERSTYIAFSGIAFFALMLFWQPLGGEIWQLSGLAAQIAYGGFGIGLFILVAATFAQNHFDLFGLRQVWLNLRGVKYTALPFSDATMYKYSRHPIYVGWLMVIWFTPHMTLSHLFLAILLTIYILIAIQYEERDLAAAHPEYAKYQQEVPMLVPLFKRRAASRHSSQSEAFLKLEN